MQYIYQNTDWNKFSWDGDKIQNLLLKIKKAQGYLFGKMSNLGFEVQNSATLQMLTENIIKSHEIEGELLDRRSVRSSIAIRLGIDTAGETPYSRNIEGVVEMMLDATQKYSQIMNGVSHEDNLYGCGQHSFRKERTWRLYAHRMSPRRRDCTL